ncbi:MAG: flagellar biosynthesis protein FlhF [Spirochaetaceae bacterium]|jgi:flagellar biosynthesis protein FlhF|nr:flagellar biosynthesis protein FlhF [Spirochaetaceae bacterium]
MDDYKSFTIQHKSYEACIRRAKELYGERIKILKQRDILTGGVFGFFQKQGYEIVGYVLPSSPDLSKYASSVVRPPPPASDAQAETAGLAAEKEKILAKAQAAAGIDPKMVQILAEVKNISEKLDAKIPGAPSPEHENIGRIDALLEQNDFLPAFRKKITARIKKEAPYDTLNTYAELEQQVLEWIGEEISIYQEEKHYKFPRIIVIVGPTGVGKTTTVTKLAARFQYGTSYGLERDYNTALLTIDKYRVAADQQLKGLANALNVPFDAASDAEELKRKLTLMGESADILFVDTIGRSPRDSPELAEMKQMLDLSGKKADFFLVVSAATKALDIVSILKQFEIFDYRSVIVTKLDETMRAGNVISALSEHGKSIAFIADGQKTVPEYLQKAQVLRLLINLDGFEVNRGRLEKCFGE